MDFLNLEGSFGSQYASTNLMSALLLSIFKEKHTPNTVESFNSEYDYIIVGAGSAGSVLAGRLAEVPDVSVLLLEAGQSPPPLTEVPAFSHGFTSGDLDWKFLTAPQQHVGDGIVDKIFGWISGKAVGGTAIFNHMIFTRGNRADYDNWSAQGAEGWSYEEVLPYFKKLEDNLDEAFVANGYHGIGGPVTIDRPDYAAEFKQAILESAQREGYKIIDPSGESQIGFIDPQFTMRNGKRLTMAKAYLVPAENRTNFDIVANAMVKRIVIENKRAVGVEFDFAGSPHFVKAKKEVILSAGTVNSAKLLMLSGIGPKNELLKHNISVEADLPVGLNLQDHYGSTENFVFEGARPLLSKIMHPKSFVEFKYKRSGIWAVASGVSILAFLNSGGHSSVKEVPDYQLYFSESSTFGMKEFTRMKDEHFDQLFSPYHNKSLMSCAVFTLNPKSRGFIRLNSSDPYDPPIIDPKYFENPEDLESIVTGLKTCRKIGTSEPLKSVGAEPLSTLCVGCEQYANNIDEYFRCMAQTIPLISFHPVGTVKMGSSSDPTAVVDPQLRVKTIEGLRVVDASVIPVIPSGNTNIPIAMIAEKAADMIKSTISSSD